MRLLLLLGALLLGAWTLPVVTQQTIGDEAYHNLVARFWYGGPTTGHIIDLSSSGAFGSPAGNPARAPVNLGSGGLWGLLHAGNAFYGYWKITGSSDAASRITAEWHWILSTYGTSDETCGGGTTNSASDDSAWTAGFLLEAYEVTADPVALTHAKALLDCVWNRWSDNGTAGCFNAAVAGAGIWYSDACTLKSSYQNVFALDNYWYYQLSGDTTYRTRAINLDTWIAAFLQRSGQTVNAHTYPNDGMYWVTVNADGSVSNQPYQIQQTSSVVLLAGDMAEAVLCARLYADTGTQSYLTRLQATAGGIYTYERDANGVALDARDARTNGWAAVLYAREVVPLLSSGFRKADIQTTAWAVNGNDKSNDQSYGGAWDGPNNGTDIWSTQNQTLSQQVEVSASAAIWPIAGMAP